MSAKSRQQYALIAIALLPCWAMAQSSLPRSTPPDGPTGGAQLSASPINVAVEMAAPANDAPSEAVAPLPAPNFDTDPVPRGAAGPSSEPGSGDQAAATGGPTSSSATVGFRASSGQLTRQQLADRARDDDGGRHGLGRDAVLMIIGGAGIVAGALIGGPAGIALIVVGAVIGITGLVLILSQ
jgi:hypothetical protein